MRVAVLVSLTIALGGCVNLQQDGGDPPRQAIGVRPAVLALLDSGINPYHVAFRGEPAFEAPSSVKVDLSGEGGLEERRSEDEQTWETLEPEQLYHFNGTRVYGISFGKPAEDDVLFDVVGHGTQTASVAATVADDLIIVLVQVDGRVCNAAAVQDECPIFPAHARALEWIAQQDWIDALSISFAIPGNPPAQANTRDDTDAFLRAQRDMHDAGMLLVNGAGNYAAPSLASQYGGPPWVVCVGGAEPNGSESPNAGHGVDVVANFSAETADPATVDGWQTNSGTSFSTPLVAAVLAQAKNELERAGHAPGPELRHAIRESMNRTADIASPTDWRPLDNLTVPPQTAPGLPVIAPGPQFGWGIVHATHVGMIFGDVNSANAPTKPDALVAYMEAWAGARDAYWSQTASS